MLAIGIILFLFHPFCQRTSKLAACITLCRQLITVCIFMLNLFMLFAFLSYDHQHNSKFIPYMWLHSLYVSSNDEMAVSEALAQW